MYIWTQEEIEKVLLQLDERGLPFGAYSFAVTDGKTQLLGKGGFASVYEAKKRTSRKSEYAIKVIGFHNGHIESKAFGEEVEAQKKLSLFHETIVEIHDSAEILVWLDGENRVTDAQKVENGSEEEIPPGCLQLQFILMERLEPVLTHTKAGKSFLNPGGLAEFEEKEILRLAQDVAVALKVAHDEKILHRDVKPENIFYDVKEKRYKLGDFGIAKRTEDGAASTVAYTKGYGAPEVIGTLEDKYDCTADIYSLGMLLFVLLNHLRFPEAESYSVNGGVQYRPGYVLPDPVSGSEKFIEIVRKMCAYNPDDRYQSMTEVIEELFGAEMGSEAGYRRKHRNISFVFGTVLLAFGMLLWRPTFQPEWEPLFPMVYYIMMLVSGYKLYRYLNNKKTTACSVILFGLAIACLVKTGFSWGWVIVLLLLVFSGGPIGVLISVGSLALKSVDVLQLGGMEFGDIGSNPWVTISCLSLAAVLLAQYLVFDGMDKELVGKFVKKGGFYRTVFYYYMSALLLGILFVDERSVAFHAKLIGEKAAVFIQMLGLEKVGAIGLAFLLIWVAREKILKKQED